VLHAKQGDQRNVDHDRGREGGCGPDVDGSPGEGEVADEHDQVKEGREENRVGENREKQVCGA
jgi:hypothetical protein